ncbi:unnamed protein product [Paramecium sonneborni]|uniref:Uncharacterized protein n=1 Tax=Paramecium sonneborni TaxID=65129 RepID=A0A8S1LM21_9CILI|nr:unnamed protein product [Paramecium sonneborni]
MIKIQTCQGDQSIDQEKEIICSFEQFQTEVSAQRQETKIRKNKNNNEISSLKKKFSITFRDEIFPEEGLVDVQIVENWKIYNVNQEKAAIADDCLCFIL